MKKLAYLFFLCGLLAVFTACENEQQHARSEIAQQEEEVENGSDPEAADRLVQQYLAYASTYADDVVGTPRYLYRAAGLQYRLGNFDAARVNLETAIHDYYENENTPNCVLLLGSIYQEKLKNKMASSVLYQTAAETFPALSNQSAVAAMERSGLAPVHQRLDAVFRAMYPDTTGRIDLRLANDFITGCSIYALINPKGTNVPQLLYQAAETSRSAQAFSKAVELYDQLIEDYPDFEKAPQALFLKGFTLENELNRLEDARAVYESFLVKYPNDDFADDAKFLLDNLGKSDDEIISSFGAKQAEQ